MVAKDFEVNDLVWAKMKGYPHWPGKIVEPPTNDKAKPKKAHHYVYFYSSQNYAWMPDENILFHDQSLVEKYSQQKKNTSLLLAIKEIVEEAKKRGNHTKKSLENIENQVDELPISKEKSPKNQEFQKGTNLSPIKKKTPPKKMLEKRKKRSLILDKSQERNSYGGAEPSAKTFKGDNFKTLQINIERFRANIEDLRSDMEELLANIPPNLGSSDQNLPCGPTTIGLISRPKSFECPTSPPVNILAENSILKGKKIKPTAKKIGCLGFSNIGQCIMRNLIQSGHEVFIWNRSKEKCKEFEEMGATLLDSAYDLVITTDIIISCLSDLHAAKKLVFENYGILKGLDACSLDNKGYVEVTSLDVRTTKAFAKEVQKRGARYLEAQLTKSGAEALDGMLLLIASGDKSLFEDCDSCFQAISRDAIYLGDTVSRACNTRIIHDCFLAAIHVAIAESLTLVKKMNLDQQSFLEMLKLSNFDIAKKGNNMIDSNHIISIPLKNVRRDLSRGLQLGNQYEQPLPIFAAANEAYKYLERLRYPDHDVSVIYEGLQG